MMGWLETLILIAALALILGFIYGLVRIIRRAGKRERAETKNNHAKRT